MNIISSRIAIALVTSTTLVTAGCGLFGLGSKTRVAPAASSGSGAKASSGGASAYASAPAPATNPTLRSSLLKCNADVTPQDVQTGMVGEYKFTEGMNTSERTGFLQKQPATMTNGCFVGEMTPGQCVSWTVNEENYKALGNSNDWEVQCVYSDAPGEGMIKNKGEYPYTMDRMKGHYFMLMCGHDQGDGYECAEGSNSRRGGMWRDKLRAEGKLQMGFCVNSMSYQETSYDDKAHPGGRQVYCQYYNKQSKQSMVGFEFLQKANNL